MGVSGTASGWNQRKAMTPSWWPIVDTEFGKLDLKLRVLRGTSRMVSALAYEAGGAAGASLAINPASRRRDNPPPASEIRRQTERSMMIFFSRH